MKKSFFSALPVLLLICAGCESLPDGEPPQGDIVTNQVRTLYSESEAADYLATRFSIFMLENYPGSAVVCDADAETLSGALYALQESYHLAGTHQEMEADLRLYTRFDNGKWRIALLKSGIPLWEEFLIVRGKDE